MSWGERSCKRYGKNGGCPYHPTLETCHVMCHHYIWDGHTNSEMDRAVSRQDGQKSDQNAKQMMNTPYSKMSSNQKRSARRKLKK